LGKATTDWSKEQIKEMEGFVFFLVSVVATEKGLKKLEPCPKFISC